MANLQDGKNEFDFSSDRVLRMNKEGIIRLFDWYDFKDQEGNPLTHCQDFLELVERAVTYQQTRTPSVIARRE